jgi:MFS transporter, DHA1 family, tetracycline resistance protein
MKPDKRLLLIYAIVLVDLIAGTAIMPIFPAFVKGLANPSTWLTGATGLFMGMQLISAPLLGSLSDKFGRRPIFLFTSIGTFFATCLLIPLRTWSLFTNRISDGLTNGLYTAVRSAITDISTKENLFKNMGIEGAIVSLGVISGPMVTGVLIAAFDLTETQQISAVIMTGISLSGLNIGLSLMVKETNQHRSTAPIHLGKELAQNLNLITLIKKLKLKSETRQGLFPMALMQIFFVMSTGYHFYFIPFASLGELQMNTKEVAYIFLYFGAMSVIANPLYFTYVIGRLNKIKAVVCFAAMGVALHIGYANVHQSVTILYLILTVDCFTNSLIGGTLDGMIADKTSENDRGEIFGTIQALGGVANLLTTLIYGTLTLFNPSLPFYWFATCVGVVAYLGFKTFRDAPQTRSAA